MNREIEMIKAINKHMPRSSNQINKIFESDAEIIDFDGKKIVYNIDEFSKEDMLREEDPYTLGWNIAIGIISDVLATGGTPRYYAHSLSIDCSWTKEYVEKLSQGIADVIKQSDVFFIGGDLSISKTWRYTGSVMGELIGAPMLRNGAKIGDDIFISGRIGIGNVEAAFKIYSENHLVKNIIQRYKNCFKFRNKEALFIKKYSNCCIDTSDGVFNALKSICDINKTGFEVCDLPYEKSGILLSKLLNMPKELLFLGECGEYELLFTINKECCEDFINKSKEMNLKFYKIGEVKENGIRVLRRGNKKIDLSSYDLSARDYEDAKAYLRHVVSFLMRERVQDEA